MMRLGHCVFVRVPSELTDSQARFLRDSVGRGMLGFIIRISGASAATRFFSAEADALAWIDEKLSGAAAPSPAP